MKSMTKSNNLKSTDSMNKSKNLNKENRSRNSKKIKKNHKKTHKKSNKNNNDEVRKTLWEKIEKGLDKKRMKFKIKKRLLTIELIISCMHMVVFCKIFIPGLGSLFPVLNLVSPVLNHRSLRSRSWIFVPGLESCVPG